MKFSSDIVIGLEIHVELDTKTKLFCGCRRKAAEKPNTIVCPVCLGHPGAKPVLNKKALGYALKLCLALDCDISCEIIFSRKSYFYPDMPKNYQITQFDKPLGYNGKLRLRTGDIVRLRRIHIEEDPASLIYPQGIKNSSYVLIDYNRAGNPLVEVVTEPELTSPAQARDFLNQLTSVLTYLKIFDAGTCSLKADANVSIKEGGYERVEIKNISGFRELEKALTYEIARQRALLRRGLKVTKETRGWNGAGKTTYLLRTKESEDDYGYIVDADLSAVDITDELILSVKKDIPELAQQKTERFIEEYGLCEDDAKVLTSEPGLADLFEKVAEKTDPQLAARWIRKELLRVLNYNKKSVSELLFDEKEIIELLLMVRDKAISETTAQRIIEQLMVERFSPAEHVKKEGLLQISSADEILLVCRKAIKLHERAVNDYFAGEDKSFHYLLGQVMRLTDGRADPALASKIMKEELNKINLSR